MHTISSYRGNRPTRPTHKQTGPITVHCAAASVQCKKNQMHMYCCVGLMKDVVMLNEFCDSFVLAAVPVIN